MRRGYSVGSGAAATCHADIPWTAAPPRRGYSVGSAAAAAATWTFRGDESRRRRGCDADLPWRRASRHRYLGAKRHELDYAAKANKVFEFFSKAPSQQGLQPIYFDPRTGQARSGKITFGALGDSYYEYLLKTWIQGGRTETRLREMYFRRADIPQTGRGDAATATWMVRRNGSQRRRGCDVNGPQRRVAATPRPRREKFNLDRRTCFRKYERGQQPRRGRVWGSSSFAGTTRP